MEKIINYLNAIAKDRYQHYTLGIDIAAVSFVAGNALLGFWWALIISIVAVVAAAKIKERYDEQHGGRFDWTDFVVTCAGGATLWIVVVLLWFSIR